MSSDTDPLFDDALVLGRRNAEIIELARRHCVHMEYRQSGGQGLLEEMSGLPINMRRVHCPYAEPATISMTMNLEGIALEFYQANCVGCRFRQPKGLVPTLASLVDAQAQAAEARSREVGDELSRQREAWEKRAEARRVLVAGAPPAMTKALADIGVVDADPSAQRDRQAVEAAVGRLEAVSDRAPDLFAGDVVQHMAGLVREQRLAELLGTLRRLARNLPEHRRTVTSLTLGILTQGPDAEAGRCLVDLTAELTPGDLTAEVIRSLVMLAGQPHRDRYGHPRKVPARNDPAGLRIAADLVPETVRTALKEMLRVAAPQPASLVLPGGIPYRAPRQPASDLERCAAAGAIATLASTHREFALSFRQALAQSLQVGDADRYDLQTGGGEQSPELQVGEPQGLAIRCQRHCRAAHLLGGERSRMPSMTQVWQNPAVTENCRDTVEGLNRRISVTGHGPPSGRPPHHPRDTWQDQSGLDASDSRPAQWRGCGIVLDTRPPRAHSHGIPPSSRNSP